MERCAFALSHRSVSMSLERHHQNIGSRTSGFTLLEMAFVVAVGMVVTTISVPMTKSALKTYHLNTAVATITGAIQTTRYQAIMRGYHHNLTLNTYSRSYQL